MTPLKGLWAFMPLGLGIIGVGFAGLLLIPANKRRVRLVARAASYFALAIFAICLTGTWQHLPPPQNTPWMFWDWGINSFLTFFIFKYDKRNAHVEEWRIESEALHLLSLAGGGIGAFLGRRAADHKTNLKKEGCFIRFNLMMTALNFIIWLGLYLWQALGNRAT